MARRPSIPKSQGKHGPNVLQGLLSSICPVERLASGSHSALADLTVIWLKARMTVRVLDATEAYTLATP
jgi:hypothetical protein